MLCYSVLQKNIICLCVPCSMFLVWGEKTTGVCKVSNITNQKIRRIIDEA